jgi:hypothetical protein
VGLLSGRPRALSERPFHGRIVDGLLASAGAETLYREGSFSRASHRAAWLVHLGGPTVAGQRRNLTGLRLRDALLAGTLARLLRGGTLETRPPVVARRVTDPVPAPQEELIEKLCGAGPVDLETLLATLSLGIAFAVATGSDVVHLQDNAVALSTVTSTRKTINLALARSCSLPDLDKTADAHQEDPLRVHREFFRRLLRSRRGDLPRVRLFTTNYDLLVEQALGRARRARP